MNFAPRSQTPDSNSHDAVLIGAWQELVAYYLSPKTGTVWSYHTPSGGWTNCGDEPEFRANFATRFRGKLIERPHT